MDKNITAAAIAIARNRDFLATEPNGSAKGRPGTFIEALARLPGDVEFIGYTPVYGLNPLPVAGGDPLGPTLFSLAAIEEHATAWESKFRRMRGDQWRVVLIDEHTFIINVHSRRPVEFCAALEGDKRYPYTIGVSGENAPASPPRKPEQVEVRPKEKRVATLTTVSGDDAKAELVEMAKAAWNNRASQPGTPIEEMTVTVKLQGEDCARLISTWIEQIEWESRDGGDVPASDDPSSADCGEYAADLLVEAVQKRAGGLEGELNDAIEVLGHLASNRLFIGPDDAMLGKLKDLYGKLGVYLGESPVQPRLANSRGHLSIVRPIKTA